MKVDNAIIMAAGTSSRFAPLSYEKPKGLITVRGEVLVERQIKQLKETGIDEIILVVGYKNEMYKYLVDKYNVKLIYNPEYNHRNNNSSIYLAKDYIKNTYICSVDNYFLVNPFKENEDFSYYSAMYSKSYTDEWCIEYDDNNLITGVKIGGKESWYMLGHAFWTEDYSKKFLSLLEAQYDLESTKDKFWEDIYIENIDSLNMKINKYGKNDIFEFDSLEELREFDPTYLNNSGSKILEDIANKLNCKEEDIINIKPIKRDNESIGFYFTVLGENYKYLYEDMDIKKED